MEHLEESLASSARDEEARLERVRPLLEDIALRASYDKQIQHAVEDAKNKMRAIVAVRQRLLDLFVNEIDALEKPEVATASNQYDIAKTVVDLLWDRTHAVP